MIDNTILKFQIIIISKSFLCAKAVGKAYNIKSPQMHIILEIQKYTF